MPPRSPRFRSSGPLEMLPSRVPPDPRFSLVSAGPAFRVEFKARVLSIVAVPNERIRTLDFFTPICLKALATRRLHVYTNSTRGLFYPISESPVRDLPPFFSFYRLQSPPFPTTRILPKDRHRALFVKSLVVRPPLQQGNLMQGVFAGVMAFPKSQAGFPSLAPKLNSFL